MMLILLAFFFQNLDAYSPYQGYQTTGYYGGYGFISNQPVVGVTTPTTVPSTTPTYQLVELPQPQSEFFFVLFFWPPFFFFFF